jgi:hypothetical protein
VGVLLGADDGWSVVTLKDGSELGSVPLGNDEGCSLGLTTGDLLGICDGTWLGTGVVPLAELGFELGTDDGSTLGDDVGASVNRVGRPDGNADGNSVVIILLGLVEGKAEGTPVPSTVGDRVGKEEGSLDGARLGAADGLSSTPWEGWTDGTPLGIDVGRALGARSSTGLPLGTVDGESVSSSAKDSLGRADGCDVGVRVAGDFFVGGIAMGRSFSLVGCGAGGCPTGWVGDGFGKWGEDVFAGLTIRAGDGAAVMLGRLITGTAIGVINLGVGLGTGTSFSTGFFIPMPFLCGFSPKEKNGLRKRTLFAFFPAAARSIINWRGSSRRS